MFGLDKFETLFVVNAFLFQIILIGHFALRKWRFELALLFKPLWYGYALLFTVSTILNLQSHKGPE